MRYRPRTNPGDRAERMAEAKGFGLRNFQAKVYAGGSVPLRLFVQPEPKKP